MSRPSAIFLSGGQMVATLNETSNSIRVKARRRFRAPWSVAKYHPKRTSRTSPIKNVSAGVISLSCRAKSRHLLLFCRLGLQHVRDRRFVHLDLHIIGHLHDHG